MNKYLDLIKKAIKSKRIMATGAAIAVAGAGTTQSLTAEQQNKLIKIYSPSISQRTASDSTGTYAYWRVCNPTSNLMLLNQLRPLISKDPVTLNTFLQSARKRQMEPTVHENMTKLLSAYGVETSWQTDGEEKSLQAALDSGIGVPVNILHKGSPSAPYGGHIIFLRSYDSTKDLYYVSDPWGELNRYKENPRGNDYTLSGSQFRSRWQGGYRVINSDWLKKLDLNLSKAAV